MEPVVFGLLERLVQVSIEVAAAALESERGEQIREELVGRITSLKVVMLRKDEEEISSRTSRALVMLGQHILGNPIRSPDRVGVPELIQLMSALQDRNETLFPPGERSFGIGHDLCVCDPQLPVEGVERPDPSERPLVCPTCGSENLDVEMGVCNECEYRFHKLQEPVPEQDSGLGVAGWTTLFAWRGIPAIAVSRALPERVRERIITLILNHVSMWVQPRLDQIEIG